MVGRHTLGDVGADLLHSELQLLRRAMGGEVGGVVGEGDAKALRNMLGCGQERGA